MTKTEYDAIIPNIGGTSFTAYYIKGRNIKLSDTTTVINIWKPKCCPFYNTGEVYKDAMIEFSGNNKNIFTYQDMQQLNLAIELAIDYINLENENLIDRKIETSYEHIKKEPQENKETSAIKYSDLEVGGIYLDNKDKKWLFLGKGTLFKDGDQQNRSNNNRISEYIYLEYTDVTIEKIGENEFKTNPGKYPDTFASKKRFFKKDKQLPVIENIPITIHCGASTFLSCNGLKPSNDYSTYEERTGGKSL